MLKTLHIIYASTSGHTEYVVAVVQKELKKRMPKLEVSVQRAEEAEADDLLRGDALLLAASSWNTGGPEGQLNPHMFMLLNKKAKAVGLLDRPVAVIGLGDDRYRYTCQAADKLLEYIDDHYGKRLEPELRVINEPYGQEGVVEKWVGDLATSLKTI